MTLSKADPKAATNAMYILACLLMLGSIAGLVLPSQKAKDTKAESKKQIDLVRRAKSDQLIAQSSVAARTWTGEDAAITGAILNLTTTLARKRGVGFVRLQPQRAALGGALEQLPYLLVVEGPFPAVAALEKDLEVPENRLAVSAFQITSSDSETNKVSASIGVVAQRVAASVGTTEVKNAKTGS